jgi:hypothetical protein
VEGALRNQRTNQEDCEDEAVQSSHEYAKVLDDLHSAEHVEGQAVEEK